MQRVPARKLSDLHDQAHQGKRHGVVGEETGGGKADREANEVGHGKSDRAVQGQAGAARLIFGNGGHASVIHGFCSGQVIAIGDNKKRKEIAETVGDSIKFETAIHPTAFIASTAKIGEGSVIMAGAVVQEHAVIGRHCIVNTLASCDHHTVVEDYAHIAPGVHLCGGVHVGEGALVGVGSCAVPGAKIEAWSLVPAGSVVK